MAQFDRLTVLNAIVDIGVIPVFYNKDASTTIAIIEACVAGGLRAVEFTNRGDLAHMVFAETMEHFLKSASEVIIGVGSVVDAPTAALYIANGANFVVGPLLNPEVARLCNRRKVPYSPGCGSVSEVGQAEELGVEIVVHRNDALSIEECEALTPERIVISPGPCTPREAGISNDVVRHFGPRVPTLGVCLGHQCIGQAYGATVGYAGEIMHGKTSLVHHDGKGVFHDLPNPLEGIRYHSLAVYRDTLEGRVSPDRGQVLSLWPSADAAAGH